MCWGGPVLTLPYQFDDVIEGMAPRIGLRNFIMQS